MLCTNPSPLDEKFCGNLSLRGLLVRHSIAMFCIFTTSLIVYLQQVTTHGHLLSSDELRQLTFSIGMCEETVSWFLLQEFDTELDFSNKVRWVVIFSGIF